MPRIASQVAFGVPELLADRFLHCRPPQGWGALHTKLCAFAMERFQVQLQKTLLSGTSPARCQVVMNATARVIDSTTASEEVLRLLGQQLVRPVRWKESMECLGKLQPEEIYECGPKKQLKALMKRINNDTWWRTGNVETRCKISMLFHGVISSLQQHMSASCFVQIVIPADDMSCECGARTSQL
eukprot:s1552_g5.t1